MMMIISPYFSPLHVYLAAQPIQITGLVRLSKYFLIFNSKKNSFHLLGWSETFYQNNVEQYRH